MKTIEQAIEELKQLGTSIQITEELGRMPTVHVFDKYKKLHKTEGLTVLSAIQSMILKLNQ